VSVNSKGRKKRRYFGGVGIWWTGWQALLARDGRGGGVEAAGSSIRRKTVEGASFRKGVVI